jgi:hypothetical protein
MKTIANADLSRTMCPRGCITVDIDGVGKQETEGSTLLDAIACAYCWLTNRIVIESLLLRRISLVEFDEKTRLLKVRLTPAH